MIFIDVTIFDLKENLKTGDLIIINYFLYLTTSFFSCGLPYF